MNVNVKNLSLRIAIIIFFVMGFVGHINDLSPETNASRCFVGAVVSFIVVNIVGSVIKKIVLSAAIDIKTEQEMQKRAKRQAELAEEM